MIEPCRGLRSAERDEGRLRKADVRVARAQPPNVSWIFQSAFFLRNGKGRDAKAELKRRRQSCAVLAGTGVRAAKNVSAKHGPA